MIKSSFDLIYSIGEDCSCAMYMNKAKLRTVSGPFDWLTKADFQTRINLILNDFSQFLEADDLALLKKDRSVINDDEHDYVENKRTGFYFYHDFPLNTCIEKDLPRVREKYQKRINSFYEKISQKNRVLFIWFSHLQKIDEKILVKSAQALEAKFGKQIHLLIIEHDETMRPGVYRCQKPHRLVVKYTLFTQKKDEGGSLTTLGDVKNCLPIFKKYAYVRPFYKTFVNVFLPLVMHPVSVFVSNKEKRRRIRKFQLN